MLDITTLVMVYATHAAQGITRLHKILEVVRRAHLGNINHIVPVQDVVLVQMDTTVQAERSLVLAVLMVRHYSLQQTSYTYFQ